VAWTDRPAVDTWYIVFVDGDEDLFPVHRGSDFRPIAFTNPIRVDVDGDGVFTPPGNLAGVEPIQTIDETDAQGVPVRLGQLVAAVGCATTDTRFGDPSAGIFYFEDGTGGIQVRERVNSTTEVRRGDQVWVGGVVSQVLGETVLGDARVEVLKPGAPCPVGVPVTAATVASEPLEGRVVRIPSVSVVSGTWPVGGAEGAVVLADASGTVELLVPPGVVVPPEASDLVDFELTALVSQRDFTPPFTSGYRLVLRDGADLFPDGARPGGMAGGADVRLGRPHPNPFRGDVTIPVLAAPVGARAAVEIHDVAGRRVRTLALPEDGRPLTWDGRDERGRSVAAGVYFVGGGAARVVKLD